MIEKGKKIWFLPSWSLHSENAPEVFDPELHSKSGEGWFFKNDRPTGRRLVLIKTSGWTKTKNSTKERKQNCSEQRRISTESSKY